jgi:hypothetical protein
MRPRLLSGWVLGAVVAGATVLALKVEAAPAHNAVTLWHERVQPVIATWTGRGNPAQAYTSSLVQIAVYDAVVAIRGGYRPFFAAIDAPDGANLDAAIATAAYRVARTRVNLATPTPALTALDTQYTDYLAAIPDGPRRPTASPSASRRRGHARRPAPATTSTTRRRTRIPGGPRRLAGHVGRERLRDRRHERLHDGVHVPITASSPDTRRPPRRSRWTRRSTRACCTRCRRPGGKTSSVRTAEMTNAVQFWTEGGFTLWSATRATS